MAKVLFGAVLILAVCVIYSFAVDVDCNSFCGWAKVARGRDKCHVTDRDYCRRRSRHGDKEHVENYGNCNCCPATCIEHVGGGMPCINNPYQFYKVCKEERCVNGICSKN